MDEKFLIVASYIAAMYEQDLCPENVAQSMADILMAYNMGESLIAIETSGGGYEKYVAEH